MCGHELGRMSAEELLKKLPAGGFFKVAKENPAQLTREQRAALIRRGNELFNKGQVALANRVFMTVMYCDGLIRVGDHYRKAGLPLEALKAYWMAPSPEKTSALLERISQVIRQWLSEGKKTEKT
jgi:hypothetical protein